MSLLVYCHKPVYMTEQFMLINTQTNSLSGCKQMKISNAVQLN